MIYSGLKKYKITSLLKELQHIPIEKETLNIPMDMFDLSVRASNALAKAGIKTISDFIFFGSEKLLGISNVGEKTIYEIENAIKEILTTGKYGNREEISSEHNNEEYIKAEHPNLTFEEQIRNSFDEKLINTPIEELNLTFRAIKGFKKAGLETINDVVNFGLRDLQANKNIGKKTIDDITNALLRLSAKSYYEKVFLSFDEAMEIIFISVKKRNLDIIQSRFGYKDGKCKTLEEIGKNSAVTRERVRQIIAKEIRRIKYSFRKKALQALIEPTEELLLNYQGIISINDMLQHEYFVSADKNQLIFLMNLLKELYGERYRIIDRQFLTSLNDEEIRKLHSRIRDAILKCSFPLPEKEFIESIKSCIGNISNDYLTYYLMHKEHSEIANGRVLTPGRLSIPHRVKLIMRNIDKPMHFTEIAKLYKNYFGDIRIKTLDIERAIHTRICDSDDFIIVGPGAFILREKFTLPHNISKIIETSKEILRDLKSISDTRYLINELKKRNIDVGHLNAYSLKPILLEYPGFVSYRKFEIGIEELSNKYDRKPLKELILEVLSSTTKPMPVRMIWKELQKKRGFPEYAIAQRLADDSQFIKVAPATYTVAKNIKQYEEKQKTIIGFSKELIQLKGNAISAFFINEVLKGTEKIKDLPLSLVEHVLATSSEFIRLANGFYDLADKVKEE